MEELERERGVNEKLCMNISSVYKNTRNYIRTGNLHSEEFTTAEGLRQGGVLSPILFNIVMDDILKEVKTKVRRLKVGYRNMEIVTIGECVFADDVAIFANNEKDIQHNLEVWQDALKKRNLKINIDKTRVMKIGNSNITSPVELNGNKVEQADIYKYLGAKIQGNGKNSAEINERLENTMKLYHAMNTGFIRKKEISVKTKMSVFNTVFRPILTYGSESWILSRQQKSKIQAVEMKYLRAVKGVTRRDRIRNEVIREELSIEPTLKFIERQQLKWFGHMVRMGQERQVKTIWQTRTARKRSRGRPRKKWDDKVAETLKEKGLTWREGVRLAKDRKEWTSVVYK